MEVKYNLIISYSTIKGKEAKFKELFKELLQITSNTKILNIHMKKIIIFQISTIIALYRFEVQN